MRKLLALLLFTGSALAQSNSPGNAQSTKVFDIQLGAPLAMQECPVDTSGKYSFAPSEHLCFMNIGAEMKVQDAQIKALIAGVDNHTKKRSKDKASQAVASPYGPVDSGRVYINFPLNDQPATSKSHLLTGEMLDGKLEEIEFSTIGVGDYELVLDELTKKYGAPSWVQPTEVQNAYGAKFKSGVVGWSFSDLGVVFEGTREKLDEGRVTVSTPKGKAAADARAKAKAGRPL
jgi:hypothetical protein